MSAPPASPLADPPARTSATTADGMVQAIARADALLDSGEALAAAEAYQAVLDADPARLAAVLGMGRALLALEAREEARPFLAAVVEAVPDHPLARFELGRLEEADGAPDAAIAHYRVAWRESRAAAAGVNLANALLAQDALAEARALAREAAKVHAGDTLVRHTAGTIEMHGGHWTHAIPHFRAALAADPAFAPARLCLARCLEKNGDMAGAMAAFEHLARAPEADAELLNEVATKHQHLGAHERAIALLERAVAQAPDYVDSYLHLTGSLCHLERIDEAQAAAATARHKAPERAEAHFASAAAAVTGAETVEHAMRALDLAPDDVDLLLKLGDLFEAERLQDAAAGLYRRVLKLDPGNTRAGARLFDLELSLCDWHDYDGQVARYVATLRRAIETGQRVDIDVFNLQAMPVDYAFIAANARRAAADIARSARARPVPLPARPSLGDRPIRLGYALAYTHFHSLPMVLKEVVERHDRGRFELFGYCINACDGKAFSRGYRRAFDTFRDVPRDNATLAAERIAGDGLDLLIDTTGLTGQNCMAIMAHRPAPLQMHAFGYSITTGADYIDYLLTDRHYVPDDWAAMSSERMLYMPHTFMPTVRPKESRRPMDRRRAGLPEDAIVFANFNHPCKFEPVMFAAWMRILDAVPGSVLWFGAWLPAVQANLRRAAEAHGIDPDRLIFAPIVKHEEHLSRLALADLALDNLHHGGGVTTVDALWVGLPLVTLQGDKPGGRLGETLCAAAGVPELMVYDLAAYEARAVALAGDPGERARLRAALLRERDRAPLFDLDRFVRDLERGYEAAVARQADGLAPATITLAP